MASNFPELIQKALLSQGPDRQTAEQQLIQTRNTDYKNYLIESVKVIIDKKYPGNLRQAAGTLIKQSANIQDQNGKFNWDYVDEGVQNHAKSALLNTLIDEDPLARLAAADAISTICSIELPRNKWIDLITSLGQNSNHQDVNVKKTAIQTLGFICEKLKDSAQQGAGFQLQDQVIENILMGIVNGMKSDQTDAQIKQTSVVALRNAIGYLQTYLEKENVRTFVFDQILGCLVNQNEDVTKEAISTLIEFVRVQYNNMGTQTQNGNYIEKLFNMLTPHLLSKNEDLVIPATEIFNTIATEYKDREERNAMNKVNTQQEVNINYLMLIKDNLMQNLLQNLLIKSDDDDEPESQIQQTTEQTLCAVIEVLGSSVIDICKTFISNTANHQDWSFKQACCLSFSALLDCPDSDQITQMLYASISVFVQMLTDNSLFLVFSASKFLAKAADLHANIILKSPNLNSDLVIILKSLQQKPQISRNICWILCFLSEQIKDNLDSPFALQITQVIQELMNNALRNDLSSVKDLSVIDCSFMGIMNLLQHSPNTSVSAEYLKHSMQHFEASYNLQGAKKENIQQGILATIHASLLSIQDEFGNDQSQEAQQLIQNIYDLIIKHFQTKGDVDSDGIYVISALATCSKEKFAQYLDGAWQYINHALQKQIDGDLFKSAIGSIADIARACGQSFNKHVDIVDTLIKCIKLPDFNRDLKLHVYVCLGDVILACKEQCTKFVPLLQETFKLGFDATKFMLQSGQQAEIDYAENLQDRIIESYTCMLHGINDTNTYPGFKTGFQDLMDFILFTTDKKYHPTIDYVRSCFTLIIDIANFYNQEVSHFVKSDTTSYLYNLLQQYKHIEENAQMIQYGTKILQQFQ